MTQRQSSPGSPEVWQVGQVPMTTVTVVRRVAPEWVDVELRQDWTEGLNIVSSGGG